MLCKLTVYCIFLLVNVQGSPTQIYTKDGIYYAEEVEMGDTAVLRCRSNGKNYFFDYWLVENKNLVIGPSNEKYDKGKYRYEILSGNLTVKEVAKEDAGDYYCVSRKVDGNQIYTLRTKLIVNYNWKEIEEHSSGGSQDMWYIQYGETDIDVHVI